MAYLGNAILAVVALATCSCATSFSDSAPRSHPLIAQKDPGTTELTSAVAPVPEATPPPSPPAAPAPSVKWTDAQILAALVAAADGREEEAKIARTRSKSARVERLARNLLDDDRELGRDLASLETHLSSEPSELRKKVADARIAASESFRGTSNIGFDVGFVDAEARYDQALLHLLDEEMIPSASSQRLRSYLQTLRSKTQADLTAAEQVQQHLR